MKNSLFVLYKIFYRLQLHLIELYSEKGENVKTRKKSLLVILGALLPFAYEANQRHLKPIKANPAFTALTEHQRFFYSLH